MSTPVTGEARVESLKLLNDPDEWPQWPALPMKRRGEDGKMPESGVVLEALGVELTSVFLENMFNGISKDTPRQDYLNFEEMLDDGWEVD